MSFDQGYCLLSGALSPQQVSRLDAHTQALTGHAQHILATVQKEGTSLADYYQRSGETFIVAAEADNPLQVCRFEYLNGTSAYFREDVIPRCRQLAEQVVQHKLVLLKDKCNMKQPGGGAFTAHQDILAYLDLGPALHVTAALFLDPATPENGTLEFADNYLDIDSDQLVWSRTALGRQPMYPIQQGGVNHGRIPADLEQRLLWHTICAEPGDVLLFHSYIPHRSAINLSSKTRRAFFFTFNLAADGDHYEQYYRMKREDFGNPRFHIATPTRGNEAGS